MAVTRNTENLLSEVKRRGVKHVDILLYGVYIKGSRQRCYIKGYYYNIETFNYVVYVFSVVVNSTYDT